MKFDVDDKKRCRLMCAKISFKSVQVCGGCCEMFRGLTFLGHSVEARGFTSSRKIGVGNGFPVLFDEIASVYFI